MTKPIVGNDVVTQIGIIVRDIATKARAWSTNLGLSMPEIFITVRWGNFGARTRRISSLRVSRRGSVLAS